MPLPHETVLCQYSYDPLDRVIGQFSAGTPEHQRFYNKNRLATEIQGAVRHSIFQQGDLLLAQQRSGDGAIDNSLLAPDQQRSVLQTCKANQQRQPMAYSPYGYRAVENGLLSLLGFNGERQDPITGHYLLGNGYRAFNPVLMRFNRPDRLSPFGKGGLNSYVYCLSDPVNLYDPHGTFAFSIFKYLGYGPRPRSSLVASNPVYKNGPEHVFTKMNIRNAFTSSIGEDSMGWKLTSSIGHGDITVATSFPGKTIKTVSTFGPRHVDIFINNERAGYVVKQRSLNLKELSYSKIPGEVLESYNRYNIFRLDRAIDRQNLWVAQREYGYKDTIAFDLAKEGKINGVRPSRVRENPGHFSADERMHFPADDPWWTDPSRHYNR